jgi:hypothetical protein
MVDNVLILLTESISPCSRAQARAILSSPDDAARRAVACFPSPEVADRKKLNCP